MKNDCWVQNREHCKPARTQITLNRLKSKGEKKAGEDETRVSDRQLFCRPNLKAGAHGELLCGE